MNNEGGMEDCQAIRAACVASLQLVIVVLNFLNYDVNVINLLMCTSYLLLILL